MSDSKIEWTESTWNPVTGCTKISSGCANCYAERMSFRLQAMGSPNYKNGFKLTTHQRSLNIPLGWKKPKIIFVNSMGDLFHKDVPFEFIEKVFDVMNKANWHQFQILTKRSDRLKEIGNDLHWPSNVWMGVSVENNDTKFRISDLRKVPAAVRFLSCEPLLGSLGMLNLKGMHWVIAGGESGPRSRPMKKEWVTEIRDNCMAQEVPFFFKQWGGVNKKKTGRLLDGRTWDDLPFRKVA